MSKTISICLGLFVLSVSAARAVTLCSGDSAATAIDLTPGTRTAKPAESIRYSTAWETNGTEGVTAVVAVNGGEISSETGSGTVEWRPTRNGTYTLTHRVLAGGVQVGATLTATFDVSHGPATPVISSVDGIACGWPVSVYISCATVGATIHYTTDGTEPTTESPIYQNLQISECATVKAVAVKDGVMGDVATAVIASVVADVKGKTYGAADPTLTATVTGLVGSDTVAYALTRAEGENVGTYTITPSGATTQGNYIVVYETANLTISPKSLTVVADAKSKVYGNADPGLTATVTGLVGSDTVAYTLTRAEGENVGTYTITPSGATTQGNYIVVYGTADLTISPKSLTVAADAKSKAYGDADPELTATVTGLVGSDTVAYTLTRVEGENVGAYTITPSGATTQGNYIVVYETADLTISPKSLTVVADAKSKVYGGADPDLTYTVSGLVGTDPVSGALTRAAGENVGTYAITQGTLDAGSNYAIAYTGAILTITPNAPVISPADGTVFGSQLSVSMSCATEGAAIYYTTDGSEPTAESTHYGRFRLSARTVVKAVAIKDGLASEVAVAEYAPGRCADPVISPANGATFEHVGQEVSIAWSGADGVLRYTTDGNDPTTNSPVYAGPFTIGETTTVKAKAFGDQYFDSAIVTANLTRVWVNVATPVIAAASSFTGSKTEVAISCATEGAAIRYTIDGTTPGAASTLYTGPFFVTDSRTVKAYATCEDWLDSAVASFSITKVWVIGDTMGAPDQPFSTGGNAGFVRVTDNTAPLGESMKSGAITHNQQSTLSTTVTGPGTVSFQWRTSCEDSDGYYDWDHAEFLIDGVVVAQLDGVTAWTPVSQSVSGDGAHTLLWRYVKDYEETVGEDCCWVADFRWGAVVYAETRTTPAPVPYAWLRAHYPDTANEYDAYESAAKETAANGVNKVWECYVAGLNPTNATDLFRAVISISDGRPVIGWTPDLNEGGTKQERVYTIEGRSSLTEGDWEELRIENGELKIGECRFFRVKVAMP